jgi:pimeloyl-ACP methyl ester carboxylesterase
VTEREVTIPAAVALAGSLTLPGGEGPWPGVLLIGGSGPVDRDENAGRARLAVFPPLRDALAAAGFAVLRYDKRGVGRSAGSYPRAGFWDLVADARAALGVLRRTPGVDGGSLFLVGHSEGATIAAALGGVEPVAGAVFLAGHVTPLAELMRRQVASVRLGDLPRPVRAVLRLLGWDEARLAASGARRLDRLLARVQATAADSVRVGLRPFPARWLREYLALDLACLYRRVRCPSLALTGAKDLQVPPSDAERIAGLVGGPSRWRVLPDVTHLLRTDPGVPSFADYRRQLRQPVAPAVVAEVRDWLVAHARGEGVPDSQA